MLLATLISLGLLYGFCLSVHRLLICSIASFPGPKLAALTWWYEFYFDVVKHGQFYKEIERLHGIYGPIVRINPTELHIKDPDWHSELYTGAGRPRDKSNWFATRTAGDSIFGTVSHTLHRKRRAALNPFFSQQAVSRLEPFIQSRVERLCERLTQSRNSGNVVEMETAYSALALDVASGYAWGKAYGCLDKDDFDRELKEVIEGCTEANVVAKHLPWVPGILMALPTWIQSNISEPMAYMGKLHAELTLQMREVFSRPKTHSAPARTIFEALKSSTLPPEEKTEKRLLEEAMTLLGAAGETVSFTLATLTYHVLSNPQVLRRLRQEIDTVLPNPAMMANWAELEQLPYLRATIIEAHRMSSVLTTRLIRIATQESLRYKDYIIPAGVPVSMTTHWTHLDQNLFANPSQFMPERFLNEDTKQCEQYVLPYSRGTRSCIGQNLANAELFLTTAHVFRRFDLELFETMHEDTVITWDRFTGGKRKGSRGVRAVVTGLRK